MYLSKTLTLRDSVEIETTPEEIWAFFCDLEKNYKAWHPEDHISFKWIGEPMQSDSKWRAEELVRGKVFKLKGTIGEVLRYRKIVFKYSFPKSLVSQGFGQVPKRL